MEPSLNNNNNKKDDNVNNFDDKLAQLLGLGFDIEVCRAALSHNDSIQSATEWILGNESAQSISSTTSQPVLSLRSETSSSSPPLIQQQEPLASMAQHQIPLSTENTHVSSINRLEDNKEVEETNRLREESMKLTREAKMEKKRDREARERTLAQIKEDKERRKLFKNTQIINENNNRTPRPMDDQPNKISEYEKTQQEIRKQKRLDRESKNKALKEIQQDRENMKLRHQPVNRSSLSTIGTSSKPINNKNNALIQFKLSNGSTVRKQFPANAFLSELYAFAREKENEIENIAMGNNPLRLISAFPKQEFIEGEKLITVQAAGFIPNVSLNVIRPIVRDRNNDIVMQDIEQEENENQHAEEEEEENDIDMPDAINNNLGIPTHEFQRLQQHQGQNTHWNWGTQGHSLLSTDNNNNNTNEHGEEHGEEEEEHDESINRQNMLSAIERRNISILDQEKQQIDSVHSRGKVRDIRSLRDTCAISVAGFLTQPTLEAHTRIKHLLYASPKVSELLLLELIHTRKLERSSMKRLADHCYLQNVCLDSYIYATDSLLQELSLSNSSSTITKLSLKGCDVITDSGIRYIEVGLKNLEYLDASHCKMTNKGIKSLTKLSQLQYLNLSKTKISDIGFHFMMENAHFKDNLQVLLMDGCQGIKSNNTFLLINNAFPKLVTLGLASTGISQQTSVLYPKLKCLQCLDVSNTNLTDEDAIRIICNYKSLRELKLSGCHQITLRGLGYFARDLQNLEMIQFPSREHDLDSVLPRYAELPLRYLDLTSFQITDEGANSIARMKKLQYLSLDGTKLTDEGVSKFSGLIDLRKLFLDRTNISDEGLSQLKGLCKLNTLSLSRTQVTNSLLILLGDFEKTGFTRSLSTLNLAQCQHISDKGIQGLKGMINLKNINLDHTNVSRQCLRHLKNLEYLKPVRLLGIERDEEEEEIVLV
ncbi:hypothetical protein INT45_002759 [Circinella minor]|uniref:UBX domain-containing protein n=1 Tax=Circinella minor TaxID=1195481 RepID=A0A8H7VF65_9FUNG|nr:hypothetical protein INT45_002759 [Circinella minor]